MKIYISGKITGLPLEVAQTIFSNIEKQIHDAGHEPVNPMRLNHDHDQSWESFMRVDIAELMTCDAIYLLKDWHESKGASMEHVIASQLHMPVFFEYFTRPFEIPHSLPIMA